MRGPADLLTEDQKERVAHLTGKRNRLENEQRAVSKLLDELTGEVLLAAVKQFEWRLAGYSTDSLEPVGVGAEAFIDLIHTLQGLGHHDSFYLPLTLPGIEESYVYVRVDDGRLRLDLCFKTNEYAHRISALQSAGISVDISGALTTRWRQEAAQLQSELEITERRLQALRDKINKSNPEENECVSPPSPASEEPS